MDKSLDISTMIGCRNMCPYCPQSVIVDRYKCEKKIMTVEDIKLILKNVDKSIILVFSGFAENFYNPNFLDILIYSYNEGYKISLWTTLKGVNDYKIKKLANSGIVFQYCGFHKYSGNGFNELEFNNTLKNFKKKINIIQSQIYNYTRKTEIYSRASNNFIKIPYKDKPIKCDFYGRDFMNDYNLVLPNGDVILCCMDYNMKHIIGNLYSDNYQSEKFNQKRKELNELRLMDNSDLLCRNCEFSINI